MADEIFGPILPVITVHGKEEAVQTIGKLGKPLALYVFATDQQVIQFNGCNCKVEALHNLTFW